MAEIAETANVAAAPEAVFALFGDPRKWAEWEPGIMRAEGLGDGPIAAGARFKLVWRRGNTVEEADYEVLEHDPPRRLAVRTQDKDFRVTYAFECRPSMSGAGTDVMIWCEVVGSGPMKWFSRHGAAFRRGEVKRKMRALAAALG